MPELNHGEDGPLYQQIGHLQGQMDSVLTSQHNTFKQISKLEMLVRTDLEKFVQNMNDRFRIMELDQASLKLKIARLRWNQNLISGGISLGIGIMTQVIFHFWK